MPRSVTRIGIAYTCLTSLCNYTETRGVSSPISIKSCRDTNDVCILTWLNRCAENRIFLWKLFFSTTSKYSQVFFYWLIKCLQLNRIFVTIFTDFTANWNVKNEYYRQLKTILLYYRTMLYYAISYKLYFLEMYYISFSERQFHFVLGSFQMSLL